MNLFNLDDILLKIVEKFERAGGLTGLLYGGLFVIAAYLISKFGDTDGLTGLIFAGLILLTAYLILFIRAQEREIESLKFKLSHFERAR